MFKRMLEKLQRGIGYWCFGATYGGSYIKPNPYIPGCWDLYVQDHGPKFGVVFFHSDYQ